MEASAASLELSLKLSRFSATDEDDVDHIPGPSIRILSSYEIGTLATIPLFNTVKDLETSNTKADSTRVEDTVIQNFHSSKDDNHNGRGQATVVRNNADVSTMDPSHAVGTDFEATPKRANTKFMQQFKKERQNRWNSPKARVSSSEIQVSRLHKGMHSLPSLNGKISNSLPGEDAISQKLRDDMFMDVLAQEQVQPADDCISQVSGWSAKDRILRVGHATEIPDELRNL